MMQTLKSCLIRNNHIVNTMDMKKTVFKSLHTGAYEAPVCGVSEFVPEGMMCTSLEGNKAEGITEEEDLESIW